ncbi:hypothetical protein, partial [Pseudomonas sp. AB12(2023)]|uniref:hypothetical protein n=1 Tax=Pseudomonas sp. AB12(2023) TaxID=3048597 RepID=UPI002B22364C
TNAAGFLPKARRNDVATSQGNDTDSLPFCDSLFWPVSDEGATRWEGMQTPSRVFSIVACDDL